jgi:hypothetical protein
VRLLPVLVRGARMVAAEALPVDLAALAGFQASALDSRHDDPDVEQLCRYIDGTVGFGRHPHSTQRTAVAGFLGLAATGPTEQLILPDQLVAVRADLRGLRAGFSPRPQPVGWLGNGGRKCWVVRVDDAAESVGRDEFITKRGPPSQKLERTGKSHDPGCTRHRWPSRAWCLRVGIGASVAAFARRPLRTHGQSVAVLGTLPGFSPQQVCDWVGRRGPGLPVGRALLPLAPGGRPGRRDHHLGPTKRPSGRGLGSCDLASP